MNRAIPLITLTMAVSCLLPGGQNRGPRFEVPDVVSIGQHLQIGVRIAVIGQTASNRIQVTVSSSDPKRLLLTTDRAKQGTASIVLNLIDASESEEFFLQALEQDGSASYTASAAGFESASGTIRFAPSAIVLFGPFDKPNVRTTRGGLQSKLAVKASRLDSGLKYVAEQQLAGGSSVTVDINNSDAAIGTVLNPHLTIVGGTSRATTFFRPAREGDSTLSATVPKGFRTPAQLTIPVMVRKPGMGLSENLRLGKNLQIEGHLGLGEPAPAGGLTVTLRSDPSRLLLAATGSEVGTGTLELKIPGGASDASYYLQSVGTPGVATYTAEAPGFSTRTAEIELVASAAVVVGPLPMVRSGGPKNPGFVASLAERADTEINVYTVFLDPATNKGSDITVQSLRHGVNITVPLVSSDPAIGTVESPVTIKSGTSLSKTRFTAKKPGRTIISIGTPEGFTASANYRTAEAVILP
jgi:hypothetical protein